MRLSILFLLSVWSAFVFAEQKIVDGNYHIHYSVFPSDAISPEVAASYQLVRSKNRALINITPQVLQGDTLTGTKVKLVGKARNLIGNTTQLEFKEVVEGKVIYYLAEFGFSNEEHFRFSIELMPENEPEKSIPLKFEKKFFR